MLLGFSELIPNLPHLLVAYHGLRNVLFGDELPEEHRQSPEKPRASSGASGGGGWAGLSAGVGGGDWSIHGSGNRAPLRPSLAHSLNVSLTRSLTATLSLSLSILLSLSRSFFPPSPLSRICFPPFSRLPSAQALCTSAHPLPPPS